MFERSYDFFNRSPRQNTPVAIRQKVDLGGNGDCGFRAIAAGILENFILNQASSANKNLLNKLMLSFQRYFPLNPHDPQDFQEHVKRTLRIPAKRQEMIVQLAYVLRQIAVDEIVKNPKRYRGAFIQGESSADHDLSPMSMRKSSTWIDGTAIAALSEVLQANIHVQFVQHDKPLPHTMLYCPRPQPRESTVYPDPVFIHLESGHYVPLLKESARFSQTAPLPAAIKPAIPLEQNDPPLSVILEKIKKSDEHDLRTFENIRDELQSQFMDGSFDKQDLLQIYTQGMPHSDYLAGFSRNMELDQVYFEENIRNASQGIPMISLQGSQEAYVVERLIHAIARGITIQQLDKESVFAALHIAQTTLRAI